MELLDHRVTRIEEKQDSYDNNLREIHAGVNSLSEKFDEAFPIIKRLDESDKERALKKKIWLSIFTDSPKILRGVVYLFVTISVLGYGFDWFAHNKTRVNQAIEMVDNMENKV